MPELPEVETIAREMREAHLEGTSITKAQVFWARSISLPEAMEFCGAISGQKIKKIARRGKFLVFTLSKHTLLVHLRMTGKFLITQGDIAPTSHERVRLWLSDGRLLIYEDQRKFGKWYLVVDPEEMLSHIGIEPLSKEFTLEAFKGVLDKRTTPIKPLLLNQKYIAGIGNIYADEALWMASIHPQRPAYSLKPAEIGKLHKAIPHVLNSGLDNLGTSLGSQRANYFSVSGRRGGHQYQLKVFRRDGLPCPRCQHTLIKIVVAQRGTHLCPFCQKL